MKNIVKIPSIFFFKKIINHNQKYKVLHFHVNGDIMVFPSRLLEKWECQSRRNSFFSQTPLFSDTRLIWTPHYYRQFSLPLGKESYYIFS